MNEKDGSRTDGPGIFDHLKPSTYGAKTRTDVGVFLVGAGVGGIIDATLDAAGFVEPFVFASLTGALALGLKQTFLGGEEPKGKPTNTDEEYSEIQVEISILRSQGNNKAADLLQKTLDEGRKHHLEADDIREIYVRTRSSESETSAS